MIDEVQENSWHGRFEMTVDTSTHTQTHKQIVPHSRRENQIKAADYKFRLLRKIYICVCIAVGTHKHTTHVLLLFSRLSFKFNMQVTT